MNCRDLEVSFTCCKIFERQTSAEIERRVWREAGLDWNRDFAPHSYLMVSVLILAVKWLVTAILTSF